MTDKDDFGFLDEEPSDWDDMPSPEPPGEMQPEPAGTGGSGRGSRTRPLLLVLLLVLALAGGYFYYVGQPESPAPAPPPSPPAKKTVALPAPPPAAQPASKEPAPAAANAPAPAKVAAPVPAAPVPAAAAAKAPPAKTAAAPSAAAAKPQPAPAPAKAEGRAAVPGEPYFLHGGAFVLKGNLQAAEKTVRRLGYEPHLQQVRRATPMTRLRVGYFLPEQAEQRLREIRTLAPDAFTLRGGDGVFVYAGSFCDIDQARRFADRLYAQGVRVEEEPTEVVLPVSLLSFGSFPDRQSAEKAAEKARRAGLEATVDKRR
jgi:hypothetical protein